MSRRDYESMSHAAIYRIAVREIKMRELGYEKPAGLMNAVLYGDSVPGKCDRHPKYTAKRSPRASEADPQGCERCWEIYERAQDGSAEVDEKVCGS